jgi:hypothetical protein
MNTGQRIEKERTVREYFVMVRPPLTIKGPWQARGERVLAYTAEDAVVQALVGKSAGHSVQSVEPYEGVAPCQINGRCRHCYPEGVR